MIHRVVNEVEYLGITRAFCQKYNSVLFPERITDELKFILVSGQSLWLRYSYYQLLDFMKLNGVHEVRVLPHLSLQAGFQSYWQFQNKRVGKLLPTIIKFDMNTSHEEFEESTKESFQYWQMDYYIFDDKLNFVIQYVQHRDFFILYFDDSVIIEGSTILEDVLTDFDEMYENSSDGFNQREIDAIKSFWLPQQFIFTK
jgi:hypothetical protein